MNYTTAFPDFPVSDMPDVPAAWVDSSWHNHICPSFDVITAGAGDAGATFDRLVVWVDFADDSLREFQGHLRFLVQATGDNGNLDLLATDDWQSVLDYCAARADLGQRYAAAVGYNPFLDCPTIDVETVASVLAELES